MGDNLDVSYVGLVKNLETMDSVSFPDLIHEHLMDDIKTVKEKNRLIRNYTEHSNIVEISSEVKDSDTTIPKAARNPAWSIRDREDPYLWDIRIHRDVIRHLMNNEYLEEQNQNTRFDVHPAEGENPSSKIQGFEIITTSNSKGYDMEGSDLREIVKYKLLLVKTRVIQKMKAKKKKKMHDLRWIVGMCGFVNAGFTYSSFIGENWLRSCFGCAYTVLD
ncbi:hypothetical protein C5167_025103 [Papaver somniferum]|uniref:Uncharacterized protein n=1 Tax=Papaver somniferum TaxID=3469 RepID=A0A4Y7JQE6_PAPSO|nr:hypothetical protein C5167_025103 [Papaver somniferum]